MYAIRSTGHPITDITTRSSSSSNINIITGVTINHVVDAQTRRNRPSEEEGRLSISTGRSNWILHRELKYFIRCLRDVIQNRERDLSNTILNTSISGVKSCWTTLYSNNYSSNNNFLSPQVLGMTRSASVVSLVSYIMLPMLTLRH